MDLFYVCVLKTHVILTFNCENTKGQFSCALIADQTQMSTNESDLSRRLKTECTLYHTPSPLIAQVSCFVCL